MTDLHYEMGDHANQKPFLTVIIPTRDRPDLVSDTLYSLTKQSFDNYEVIVSDNYINNSCKEVVDKYKEMLGTKLIYLNPSKPLPHCDHWDFAVKHAKGHYVTILMDKYMFYPFAISDIYKLANEHDCPDMISWWCEGTVPIETSNIESAKKNKVVYYPNFSVKKKEPIIYDSQLELKRRRNNSGYNITEEKELYFRGKIVSGAFKNTMIKEIIKKHGRLFPPYAPDYTSITLGLTHANKCLDTNKVLAQYIRIRGNGYALQNVKNSQLGYLDGIDGYKYYNLLPIKGLYLCNKNWIAWDYYANYSRESKIEIFLDLNYKKLTETIRESMKTQVWDSEEQELQQKKVFEDFVFENNNLLEAGSIEGSVPRNENNSKKYIKVILSRLGLLAFVIKMYLKINDTKIIKISDGRRNIYNLLSEYHLVNTSWEIFVIRYHIKKILFISN